MARLSGASLARARADAGLTQAALAQLLGVSSATRIYLWEQGYEQPRPHLVPRIAHTLGVEPMELLDADPERPTLSALRLAAGLSRESLAERAGLSTMRYHRLERGTGNRQPDNAVVEALANVLNASQDVVLAAISNARQSNT